MKYLKIVAETETVFPEFNFWEIVKDKPVRNEDKLSFFKIEYKSCEHNDEYLSNASFSLNHMFLSELCEIGKLYGYTRRDKLLVMEMPDYEETVISLRFYDGCSNESGECLCDDNIPDWEADEQVIIASILNSTGDCYGIGIPQISRITYSFETKSFQVEKQDQTSGAIEIDSPLLDFDEMKSKLIEELKLDETITDPDDFILLTMVYYPEKRGNFYDEKSVKIYHSFESIHENFYDCLIKDNVKQNRNYTYYDKWKREIDCRFDRFGEHKQEGVDMLLKQKFDEKLTPILLYGSYELFVFFKKQFEENIK